MFLLTYTFLGSSSNSIKPSEPQASETALGPRVVTPLGFRPNSLFVGFQFELDQIQTRLQNKKRRELGTCSVLVWGDVGSGKTHLVRQFFFQHRSDYPEGIFWVDCKSTESIMNGYWDIGTSVGLNIEDGRNGAPSPSDGFIDAVRKRLESREGWLLVFDGITFESDKELEDFMHYLPDRSGNNIIFTSVDRTLAKKQRLFNPSAVRVRPLAVPEACDLLFRTLSIRKPSTIQQAKAIELVKDYQCLPLAVHAASHALVERGKALERYSRGISDTRLIYPFLEIVSGLRDKKHFQAINLIVLLSFFHHSVPVALIHYGYKSLREFNVDIFSPMHADAGRKDLDSTISILMKSGLLERTLQAYPRSSGHGSPEESRSFKQPANGDLPSHALIKASDETPRLNLTEESSGLEMVLARLQTETDQSSMSSGTSTIDVVRIHTVVQQAVRNDLKDRSSKNNDEFWWWLGASVRLLTHSFNIASERMRKSSGHGLVRDYREYETQAKRLWSFFPRSATNASTSLRNSRHELHDLIRVLRREIQNQSPSQSSDNSDQKFQGSIFERSSSTSEGSPETPMSDLIARARTWTVDPARSPSESPTALEWSGSYGSAIDTDDDSWPNSDVTEMPNRLVDRHRRSSALRAIFEGKPLVKKRKDLGEWKPMPAPPSLSQPNIQIVRSRTSSTAGSETRPSRPMTASSEAEAALAAVHKSSPPASQYGRVRSTSRGSTAMGVWPTPGMRSPNSQLSPLASDFSPSEKQPISSSSSPSRINARHPSTSPRLVQALLTNRAQSTRGDLTPLQIENISLAYPRSTQSRPPATTSVTQSSWSTQPITSHNLPTGYTSVPMSRNTSADYGAQASSAMKYQQFHVGSAPLQTFSESDLHDLGAHMYDRSNSTGFATPNAQATEAERALNRQNQRQDLSFGRVDEWVNISPSPTTPIFPSFEDALGGRDLAPPTSAAVRFGGMEPVTIQEARDRAAIGRERSAERQKVQETSRGRSRVVGLGIDEHGDGKGKGKENVPMS